MHLFAQRIREQMYSFPPIYNCYHFLNPLIIFTCYFFFCKEQIIKIDFAPGIKTYLNYKINSYSYFFTLGRMHQVTDFLSFFFSETK